MSESLSATDPEYIRAVHDLGHKTIHLRSLHGDRKL
jgi:hypothetical protein